MGKYIVQSLAHSTVAAAAVSGAIRAWGVTSPLIRQRLGLIVIIFPIFSYPLCQLINSQRGSLPFRTGSSLLDTGGWLALKLPGGIPLSLILILIVIITSAVFLFQEMIPILRHTIETRRSQMVDDEEEDEVDGTVYPAITAILSELKAGDTGVTVIDSDSHLLYSATGSVSTIFISSGLMEDLDYYELKAVLAHEIAHIQRNRRPFLIAVFIMRVLMFFNPVVLLEFRNIVQEEEVVCDDIAASQTRRPDKLALALENFYHRSGGFKLNELHSPSDIKSMLEADSHNMHLKKRIDRLRDDTAGAEAGTGIVELTITLAVTAAISYFIV